MWSPSFGAVPVLANDVNGGRVPDVPSNLSERLVEILSEPVERFAKGIRI